LAYGGAEGGNDGERHHAIFRKTHDQVQSEAKRNNETQVVPGQLQEWWDRLDKEISGLPQSQPRQLSALQVVERLDRFVFKTGKNPAGSLQAIWRASFDKLTEKLAALLRLVDGDPNFELEHIFPLERPSTDVAELKGYGFLSLQDYERFSGSLGNRILIWKSLNKAIGNNWPDIKAEAYASQSFAQTIVPPEHRRASAMNLGRTLQAVGDTRFHRLALEMRRIELALFAVRRF
jgi:Protein of unknown function (DUF1524)